MNIHLIDDIAEIVNNLEEHFPEKAGNERRAAIKPTNKDRCNIIYVQQYTDGYNFDFSEKTIGILASYVSKMERWEQEIRRRIRKGASRKRIERDYADERRAARERAISLVCEEIGL